MWWKAERCITVLIFCVSIHPSTSAYRSIVSTLDNLEEVDNALAHAQNSLHDLTALVFEVFTTESTTEEPTSGLTTVDTGSSATSSLATTTPTTSGETESTTTTTAFSSPTTTETTTTATTSPSKTTTAFPSTTTTETTTTATTSPSKTTTTFSSTTTTETTTTATTSPSKTPTMPPETTDNQTVESTDFTTDLIENITTFDDLSFGDRLYRVQRSMIITSRKLSPMYFLREMLVRIPPYEFRESNDIDQYSGLSDITNFETDAYGNSAEENISSTEEVPESTQETTTAPPTTTLGPWGDRVYSVLDNMMKITKEISDGQVDHEHAFDLNESAMDLDKLVIEGSNDTSVLEGMSQEDLDYLNFVKNQTSYTRQDIQKQINKAKDDKQEMIVAITVLSVLFVLVLVGLVVAMMRPWASGFRLPGSKKKMRNTHDESSYISNASFQDRSQQMRLNERRIRGEELSV